MSIPVIDFNKFFAKETAPEDYKAECAKVAAAFHEIGIVICKDPRVHNENNDLFLDTMEKYFGLSDGKRDARPETGYQVGVTPELVERARNHCDIMGAYKDEDKPLSPCPPELDAKWRFFWRIGDKPATTKYPTLNSDPVIPPEIPEWSEVMNMWGTKMLSAVEILAEMAAVGFGLPEAAFNNKMKFGPHLLAPTGSDFNKYAIKDTILAGYHSDLNFMTIHGKSRYPGLYAWTREGKKISVSVPDGCLLVQSGKQFEYLTGGYVMAGYHEVVVTDQTLEAINKRKAEGKSLWRVSSTLFSHVASDAVLEPLDCALFNEHVSASDKQFPAIEAGQFVKEELEVINLLDTK